MAAIIANSTALNAVVSSSAAISAVAASQTAMAAIIGNSTALNTVVSSQTAMAAVAASSVSRNAIMGSNAAKTALAASPLKKTVTKSTSNNWENRTISTGKGWVINCYNANSGGEAGSTWYNLDGTQYKNGAGTVSVNRFFISSFSVYWWSSTSSVTYIPC